MPSVEDISRNFLYAAGLAARRHGFEFDEDVRAGLSEMTATAATKIIESSREKSDERERDRYIAGKEIIGAQAITVFVDEMLAQKSQIMLSAQAAGSGDFRASHPWVIEASIFRRAKELFCPFLWFC